MIMLQSNSTSSSVNRGWRDYECMCEIFVCVVAAWSLFYFAYVNRLPEACVRTCVAFVISETKVVDA